MMMRAHRVAVLVGSLREGSLNRRLAKALMALAPKSLSLELIDYADLPMFNEDWEASPPPAVTEFKTQIQAADAVLFVTPEYNRSLPGGLKNAIDVGSRPYGQSAWAGKPGAVITASPSAVGGFGANHHLRQCMVFLDVPMMAQPEAYWGTADKLLDGDGQVAGDEAHKLMTGFLDAFVAWIERATPPAPGVARAPDA
jgi:chromate reductase